MKESRGVAEPVFSPIFGLDEDQQVVFWSQSAEKLFDIPASSAVGRPCYELLRGRDFFGHSRCSKECPAFRALLGGHFQSGSALQITAQTGRSTRAKLRLIALPEGSGTRVLAFLGHQRSLPSLHMGYVSLALGPSIRLEALQDVLDLAAEATDMEVAELFLLDQQTQQMVLVAQRGPNASAFAQITQFPMGEGYPGLVAQSGASLTTPDVRLDDRYLRSKVKAKGFRSYICVPLIGPEGVLGALNVASRHPRDDLQPALDVLRGFSLPLGAAISASILRARDSISDFHAEPGHYLTGNVELLLRQALQKMMAVTGASGATATLYDPEGGKMMERTNDGRPSYKAYCEKASGGAQCPAWREAQSLVHAGPRGPRPLVCRSALWDGPTICIPLIGSGKPFGVVSLRHSGAMRFGHSGHLPVLSAMAGRLAGLVQNLQTYRKTWDEEAAAGKATLRGRTNGLSPSIEETERSRLPGEAAAEQEDAGFLDIRCFGDFVISRGGEVLTRTVFPRRQVLTALKILLLHPGRRVNKDVLMEHLWPGVSPDAGANRVHVVINALRRALEPSKHASHRFVLTDGDSYFWNTEAPYRLDAEEFHRAVQAGETLELQGNTDQALGAYRSAARLYRGDLMTDEPYSDWCWTEREFLRELYLNVVRKTARALQERGDRDGSIRYYRQALRTDPLQEEVLRELMRCLRRAGRRDEALRSYESFRRLLRAEMDIDPLPETQELFQEIVAGKNVDL